MKLLHLDIESTGTDPVKDRICQIAFAMDNEEPRKRLINPEMSIPPAATEVHGITDEMVADAPTFRQVAKSLLEKLTEADAISGFNIESFDLPLLSEEFARVGIVWPAERPKIIDVYRLYAHWYPRKLANAVATYCGREQTSAHDAAGDVIDSRDVLAVMQQRPDFEEALVETHDKGQIDLAGKLVRDAEGDAVYTFGQHRGKKLRDEPGFARWMLGKDFASDTKRAVEAELAQINSVRAGRYLTEYSRESWHSNDGSVRQLAFMETTHLFYAMRMLYDLAAVRVGWWQPLRAPGKGLQANPDMSDEMLGQWLAILANEVIARGDLSTTLQAEFSFMVATLTGKKMLAPGKGVAAA